MSNNIHKSYRRFTKPLKRFVILEKIEKKRSCIYQNCVSLQYDNGALLKCERCGDIICPIHRHRPTFKKESYVLCNHCFEE